MGKLAKMRRIHIREKVPLREIAPRTGLSRNTVRTWLRHADAKRSIPKHSDDSDA